MSETQKTDGVAGCLEASGPLLGNLCQRLNGLASFTVSMQAVIQLKKVKFTHSVLNIRIIFICIWFCLAFPSSSGFFFCSSIFFSVVEGELKCHLECPSWNSHSLTRKVEGL